MSARWKTGGIAAVVSASAHPAATTVAEYLAGMLAGDVATAVAEHLSSCRTCRETAIQAALFARGAKELALRGGARRHWKMFATGAAATAVVLTAIGVGLQIHE